MQGKNWTSNDQWSKTEGKKQQNAWKNRPKFKWSTKNFKSWWSRGSITRIDCNSYLGITNWTGDRFFPSKKNFDFFSRFQWAFFSKLLWFQPKSVKISRLYSSCFKRSIYLKENPRHAEVRHMFVLFCTHVCDVFFDAQLQKGRGYTEFVDVMILFDVMNLFWHSLCWWHVFVWADISLTRI